VPGCVCVMVMFPLGILVQLAYYRYWHPKIRSGKERTGLLGSEALNHQTSQPTKLRSFSWSGFLKEVKDAQTEEKPGEAGRTFPSPTVRTPKTFRSVACQTRSRQPQQVSGRSSAPPSPPIFYNV